MESIANNVWNKSKLLVKAMVIALIILLLQIPSYYIQGLVEERAGRQQEAITEISSKWAGRQTLAGPVLVLPYRETNNDTGSNKNAALHYATFLPDELNLSAVVTPIEKYRGIYKVMLFEAVASMNGTFNAVDPSRLNIPSANVLWNDAYLKIHVSDIKGLNEQMEMTFQNRRLNFVVDPSSGDLTAPLPLSGPNELMNSRFSSTLHFSGAEQLLFTPLGKATNVQISSPWPHPSFIGDILPQTSQVRSNGFSAQWKSMAYKRSFPQQWKDNDFVIATHNDTVSKTAVGTEAFGVDLFVPVSNYQKTMRSVKYSFLCILLTLAAFFLIETSQRATVHPFQYGLVGLAMVLFYTLLLSFSEYAGFTLAYLVASLCTIGLVAWFVNSLFNSVRSTMILCTVLALLYLYVFIILQLQDYALLLGSMGLFLGLAAVMRYSRKIQW